MKKTYIIIGIIVVAVFALSVIVWFSMNRNNTPGEQPPIVVQPSYLNIFAQNIAEQYNTYFFNYYNDLYIVYAQSTERFKPSVQSRIDNLTTSQQEKMQVATIVNPQSIKYLSESSERVQIRLTGIETTTIDGQATKKDLTFTIDFIASDNDWLVDNIIME